jgi:hydrogenase-4 component B
VRAHDCGWLERIGLTWLALGCVALGLFPLQVIRALGAVTHQLIGAVVPQASSHWWALAPVPGRLVSYEPLVFLTAILLVVFLTVLVVHFAYRQRVRRGPAWDCGAGGLTARMQDTAEGFGQPIRNLFQPFFAIERELPEPSDRAPRYRIVVRERIWRLVYEPIVGAVETLANTAARIQRGRISVYLLYSFVTLLVLLAVALFR